MSKDKIRDKLISMHFKNSNSIEASSLTEKLKYIPNTWKRLHELCEENIEYFDKYSNLNNIFKIKSNEKEYLIINLGIFRFIVIDIVNKKSLEEAEIDNLFDNELLKEMIKNQDILRMHSIDRYNGNIDELIDFYEENKDILSLSRKIHYRLYYNKAWTYFLLDLVNGKAQLGFQTEDQYLYEQVFLEFDLTPSSMQDAISKMGIDKMMEIISKAGDIKVPIKEIPKDLLEEYKKHHKEYVK